MTESLVWLSVYKDLGICPMPSSEGEVSIQKVLELVRRGTNYFNFSRRERRRRYQPAERQICVLI